MRRKLPLLLGVSFVVFAAAACEGPPGARGPVGPEGPQGPAGPEGPPGPFVVCSDCHGSDAEIVAVEQQFALSPHGVGNFEVRGPDYAGGACVMCHTHQGFVEAVGLDADWSAGVASMNCRTCHRVHTDYARDDYALTTVDPVTLLVTGETVDLSGDDTPGSNLCAVCHQARSRAPWPSYQAPVDQLFEITSSHYGVHHGTQANVYTTRLAPEFEFGVATTGSFVPHDDVSCNGCHMGVGVEDFTMPPPTPDGELFHTFEPATEVCAVCHDADLGYGGVQEEVAGMLSELGACLEAEGVIEIEHDDAILADHGGFDAPEYHPVVGTHPEPYVAAYLTFNALIEDGSFGVHQPRYVVDLGRAALEFMQVSSERCPASD